MRKGLPLLALKVQLKLILIIIFCSLDHSKTNATLSDDILTPIVFNIDLKIHIQNQEQWNIAPIVLFSKLSSILNYTIMFHTVRKT